jgi:hypothetical protein
LSQVARQADDNAAAAAALDRLFHLPRQRSANEDPWLEYDHTHGRDADALLSNVRKALLTGAK